MYVKCIKPIKYFTVGDFYRLSGKAGNEYMINNDEGYYDLVSAEYFDGIYDKLPQTSNEL